ncbi:nucleotidyltransferase family protein [Virgibacillus sp. DJP39]|uniref:nucleotidyltransferase family protein n=1 Tax=Virgibacillus sp. DJP39 TaxID=3409790 RepID=UPI003BB49661
MSNNKFSAIVLAAGQSSRMGELKALLLWQEVPLICYQIEQLQKAGVDEIIVVLGHKAPQIKEVIEPYTVKTVFNQQYKQGKSTSIRKGVASVAVDPEGIFFLAIDQPVTCQTLKKLMEHFKRNKPAVVIPVHQGKRGHPILFHDNLKNDLLVVNEETKGLRDIIQKHHNQLAYLAVNDPAILLNFNKPSDYSNYNLRGGIQ